MLVDPATFTPHPPPQRRRFLRLRWLHNTPVGRTVRAAVRERDRDRCRFCWVHVSWGDRSGPFGGVYHRLDLTAPLSAVNCVVACRSCNTMLELDRQIQIELPDHAARPLLRDVYPGRFDHGFIGRSKARVAFVRGPLTIPRSWASEDGDAHWLEGHVDPALAVLACVFTTMVDVGACEAMQLLTGGRARQGRGGNDSGWDYERQSTRANELVDSVRHVYLKPNPADEEQMLPADPLDRGATAWTRVGVEV